MQGWEALKSQQTEHKELLEELEQQARLQLFWSKIMGSSEELEILGLNKFQSLEELEQDPALFYNLVFTVGRESVLGIRNIRENDIRLISARMENVGVFWAVALMYLHDCLFRTEKKDDGTVLRLLFSSPIGKGCFENNNLTEKYILPVAPWISRCELVTEERPVALPRYQRAMQFAQEAHAGTFRKGTETPYVIHPIEASKIVMKLTKDPDVIAAALLHDTLEDTFVTEEDLKRAFGKRVAWLVKAESENKRAEKPAAETWKIRKQETIDHLHRIGRNPKIICLADKLANMRDLQTDWEIFGDSLWNRFNAPDDGKGTKGKKANIGWYYRSVADALAEELQDTDSWKELDRRIREVFSLEYQKPARAKKARLVGCNKALEKEIRNAAAKTEHGFTEEVRECLQDSMSAEDLWLIPVTAVEETGMSEEELKQIPKEMYFPGKQGFLMNYQEQNSGKKALCVYVSKETADGDCLCMGKKCKEVLEDFVNAPSDCCELLQICAGEHKLTLDRERVKKILTSAEKWGYERARSKLRYQAEPLGVIDANRFLDEWNQTLPESSLFDGWEMIGYPVMPDGTILLLFSVTEKIYKGKSKKKSLVYGSPKTIRALQYRMGENGPEQVAQFEASDILPGCFIAAFVREGKLFAVLRDPEQAQFYVQQIAPEKSKSRVNLEWGHPRSVSLMGDGKLAARLSMGRDGAYPMTVYNEDGSCYQNLYDEECLTCVAMTVDDHDTTWCHLYPSNDVIKIPSDWEDMKDEYVDFHGFKSFAMSTDESRLLAFFGSEENDGDFRIFVMERDSGNYTRPIRVEFPVVHEKGSNIRLGAHWGVPETGRSFMILEYLGRLYWLDANMFCDDGESDL